LLGDRAYDADPLDDGLGRRVVGMIAPYGHGRARPRAQDGRPLRRCRRRWEIGRLFARLGTSGRLVGRDERHPLVRLGFVRLGFVSWPADTASLERQRVPPTSRSKLGATSRVA
jgi:hypothetical protein